MKIIKKKKTKQGRVSLEIEFEEQEIKTQEEIILRDISKDVHIPGFRPGKAPLKLVRDKVGTETLERELVSALAKKAVEKTDEEPITPLSVVEKDLSRGYLKLEFFTLPPVELPDYKKIAGKKRLEPVSVEEQEIEDALLWLRKSRASFSEVQREAREGDFIEITYSSPQINEGRTWEDAFVLGKGHFVEGFEKELIGLKQGEEKEFEVVFPPDYHQRELANKKARFKVKIRKIKEMHIPPATDEFARSLGKFKDIQELKKSLKEGILKEKEMASNKKVQEEILKEIVEKTKIDIPSFLIDLEKERLKKELGGALEQRKGIDSEKIEDSIHKEAVWRIKKYLVIEELIKEEKITIEKDEVESVANELLLSLPPESVKNVPPQNIYSFAEDILKEKKIAERLLSWAKRE